jgi:hypothetical protein
MFGYRGPRVRRPDVYIVRSLTSFVFVLLSVSFSVGVILAVGVLLYTQICVVLRNKTGIEEYICEFFFEEFFEQNFWMILFWRDLSLGVEARVFDDAFGVC